MAASRNQKIAAATAAAVAIAIPAEGLRRTAYLDPPGILTVCYGHTGGVVKGKVYTLDECKALLDKDMANALAAVDRCAPNAPWQVLAAFGDAVYNIGPTVACDKSKSTAARLLAAEKWEEACKQLPRWNKSNFAGVFVELPGLTKRRAKEMDLCLSYKAPSLGAQG